MNSLFDQKQKLDMSGHYDPVKCNNFYDDIIQCKVHFSVGQSIYTAYCDISGGKVSIDESFKLSHDETLLITGIVRFIMNLYPTAKKIIIDKYPKLSVKRDEFFTGWELINVERE